MPSITQLLEYTNCIVYNTDFLDSRPVVRLERLVCGIFVNVIISVFNRREFDDKGVCKPVLKSTSVKAIRCVPRNRKFCHPLGHSQTSCLCRPSKT